MLLIVDYIYKKHFFFFLNKEDFNLFSMKSINSVIYLPQDLPTTVLNVIFGADNDFYKLKLILYIKFHNMT